MSTVAYNAMMQRVSSASYCLRDDGMLQTGTLALVGRARLCCPPEGVYIKHDSASEHKHLCASECFLVRSTSPDSDFTLGYPCVADTSAIFDTSN